MTHGVPADFPAQVHLAVRLAKARGQELYGVQMRDGRVQGLERTPERRAPEPTDAPKSSRGVQAMLL